VEIPVVTSVRHEYQITVRGFLKFLAALLLALPLLVLLWITIFGWNWARGPLQSITFEKTGRELVIAGDLSVSLQWPAPRVHAKAVTFANPPWAKERQMLSVDDVEFTVDLPELLVKKLVFPEVHLTRPSVFLELAADGRKTWLLDLAQSDESARIPIGLLTLDHGQLGYDDARQKTSIRLDLSSQAVAPDGKTGVGVEFSADGLYKGLALAAKGSGGTVLALRDESVPYPIKVEATIGRTVIKAEGTVTSLLKFTAMDIQLALRGDNLAQLYPLLGIAFPQSHPYATTGRMVHSGKMWRYDKFSGHTGKSDLAGTLQIDTGGVRPFMHGELVSQLLDIADLGPLIGAKELPPSSTPSSTPTPLRILPDVPFKTERWTSVDADVMLRAKTIRRAKALPLENLATHLKMQNSVLTLDPLDFGFAGGHLKATISLDGRQDPILANTKIEASNILLAKLLPTVNLVKTSMGQIKGEFNLAGKGNSIDRMLATSNGRISLHMADGEISKLLMEEISLHLLEMLQLKLVGDKTIKLRCAMADFSVNAGIMQATTLLLDTEVNTVTGSGSINLGQETLDLTLTPKTRSTSAVALRGPIYVSGTFAKPKVALDQGRIAARGLGALALGIINPLLVLVPLVEMGPGVESKCAPIPNQDRGSLSNRSGASSSGNPK
jgi:uncharacterized protein involved in outer membrane biogenesis